MNISVVWGFLEELESYWLNGLTTAADLRLLLTDRMTWWVKPFQDLALALQATAQGGNNLDDFSRRAIRDRRAQEIEIQFPYQTLLDWLPLCLGLEREVAGNGRQATLPPSAARTRIPWTDGFEAIESTDADRGRWEPLVDNAIPGAAGLIELAVVRNGPEEEFFLRVYSWHPFNTAHEHYERITLETASYWFWRMVCQHCEPTALGKVYAERFIYSRALLK